MLYDPRSIYVREAGCSPWGAQRPARSQAERRRVMKPGTLRKNVGSEGLGPSDAPVSHTIESKSHMTWKRQMLAGPTFLVIAHPGHELCLHKWGSEALPRLVVLTTGSRSGDGRERLDACLSQCEGRGVVATDMIGEFPDRELYRLIMQGKGDRLSAWSARVRSMLVSQQAARVVVDAWQGYSVAHDLTHLLTQLAVAEAELELDTPIELLEFSPVPAAKWPRRAKTPVCVDVRLSAQEAATKLGDACSIPELRSEIEGLGIADSPYLLDQELLYVCSRDWGNDSWLNTPYYEAAGAQRVAAGIYATSLTRAHFRSVAEPLIARINALRA